MKKYLAILFLMVFIIPSVALASWWNPFSWKIFKHEEETSVVTPINAPQDVNVDIKLQNDPLKEIQELKHGVEDLKKQQSNISTPTTKKVKKLDKIAPSLYDPNQVVDVCLNIEGIQSKIPEGYSSITGICTLLLVKDYCPNIDGIQSKVPDGMFLYKKTNQCLTQSEIDIIVDKIVDANSQTSIREQCKDIVLRIKEKENLMRNIEAKYRDLIATTELNPEGKFGGAVQQDIMDLNKKKQLEIEPIEFERDIINQEYVRTCN